MLAETLQIGPTDIDPSLGALAVVNIRGCATHDDALVDALNFVCWATGRYLAIMVDALHTVLTLYSVEVYGSLIGTLDSCDDNVENGFIFNDTHANSGHLDIDLAITTISKITAFTSVQ